MSDLKRQKIAQVSKLVANAEKQLAIAQKVLEELSNMGAYEDVEGILGIYDGKDMVTEEGEKYEVNPNYAAKSMLVIGDGLKRVEVEEEDKTKVIYKQVTKVDRKKLEGILSKKDGKWFALTDDGSFRLLDTAVEYRMGEADDKVFVQIPENGKDIKWAALEKLIKPVKEVKSKEKKVEKEEKKPAERKAPAKRRAPAKKPAKKRAPRKPAPKKKEEKVSSISTLDDDDLR